MLKNISIFVFFSFFSGSIEQDSSLDEPGPVRSYKSRSSSSWSTRGGSSRGGSRSSFRGGQKSRASIWDKCSKQTITDGEIKCDINNGRGNYPIETAVCTATCKDGYLMIGMTFDFFFQKSFLVFCVLKVLFYLTQKSYEVTRKLFVHIGKDRQYMTGIWN